MNQNLRFYALIGVVAVVIGGLFLLVRGRGGNEVPSSKPAPAKQAAEQSHETSNPHEAAAPRGESRLTPTASRASAPHEATTSKKVGNYAISGQVVLKDDDSPVEDAEVSVYWMDKDAAFPVYDDENVWTARTNVKGFYRVTKLPASQYFIVAKKGELAGVSGAAINSREPEDAIANVVIGPVGAISGTVMNEKREPVPGALVALGAGKKGNRDIYSGRVMTKSGPDGTFEMEYVQEGTWTIESKADGYAVAQVSGVASNAKNVEIVLKKGAAASGSVVLVDGGKPVPNAKLALYTSGPGSQLNNQKTTTDGDGKFAFADLADGTYGIQLDKSPYIISGQVPPITIQDAKPVENLQISVVLGGSISGRATDAVTGAPIKGMAFSTSGGPSNGVQAETDEEGMYKIEGLQSGRYVVQRKWMAGYRHGEDRENKSVTVALGEEVTGIDFAVPPGLTMRGTVVDKDGEPLGNVDVTSQDATNTEGESMVTDEKGRWVHRGFSAGTVVTIVASKAGYSAPPMQNITIPDHDLDGVEIVMDTGASIEGTVVDKKGEPVPEVYVTAVASNPAPANMGQQTGWSRDDGSFKVQGLDEGNYKLQARPPRSWGQPTPTGNDVHVGKGEHVTGIKVVVDFDSGSKIAGRIVDTSGKPIKGANVQAYMPSGGGGNATTDEEGKYEILGLQAGSYYVNVYHQNYSSFQQQQQVEAPNPNFNITLKGKGTIKGHVLEAGSGNPVRTFSIMAMQGKMVGNIDPGNFWGNNGQTFVNENGEFEIQVADGGATLYVQSQGYAPKAVPIADTKEGETKSNVEIRLDAGGAIDGTVVTKAGQPVEGARIYVGRAPMGDWERRERPAAATTDASGAFHLDSLPAQEVRLFAVAEGSASASASATPASGRAPATVKIVLGGGGTVKGTVRVGGKPAAGYGVSIYSHDGGYQNNMMVDANGNYAFSGVPEGVLSVMTYRSQDVGTRPGNMTKQAEIAADQTSVLDFDLAVGTAVLEGVVTREGQAVSGAYVNVSIKSDADTQQGAGAQSDTKGAFHLEGLPAGSAGVSVFVPDPSGAGQRSRNFHVELADGQTTRLDANLSGGSKVGGTVTGIPSGWMAYAVLVSGRVDTPSSTDMAAMQEMYRDIQDRIAGTAQVNPDGTFRIEGAEPGEYTVMVNAMNPQSAGQEYKVTTATVNVSENGEASVSVTLK